ncbi:RsmB/NOP family class I SAM-dependent RNA methyltransferase [Sphingomonas desiccabilis]|uniref:RsmB/NOP family class I SAM-dependent RNA methyltransferase n=1 Tax=Sphingomonas desiccabilis TaxID=429134 RepID=A0A4Q2IXP4_9SPHN|nr:RsmB/NOP family class I SAM-dependent RNA methyltransferase [Sphingomonas desiccabilis]MBB3910641.1 16S rRNA (cytosine967-C5)-methyltransferase [Sphingomonas desiccabilis]RXZ35266.1 RsmB/NOP family class I SAM-dependent RNA methyltransferase [Sphingomonas desiccabilis]
MTPAARAQAAIDLLDAVIEAARSGGAAADTIAQRFFAARRYAGSKDRRAIRALVWEAIRSFGERPASGRAAIVALARERPELAECFDGSAYGPASIQASEPEAVTALAPAWLIDALAASDLDTKEVAALLERAPVDVRVNRLKADRASVQAEIGGEPLRFAPDALRLGTDAPVEPLPAWREGRIEVQDAGSQIVGSLAGAKPGMCVVDLCAGGGGKTLSLAATMDNHGRIVASDTDRPRLSKLPERAARAGVTIAETRLLDPKREAAGLADLHESADVVLVDAPCSATGTWRRNPEARWRLTPERLDRFAEVQSRLLDVAAQLVRPGGSLTYVVCSLLDKEGRDQVAAFMGRHPSWSASALQAIAGRRHGEGLRLTPAHDGTDGFFVARLARA